jgi:hypothetical protein
MAMKKRNNKKRIPKKIAKIVITINITIEYLKHNTHK